MFVGIVPSKITSSFNSKPVTLVSVIESVPDVQFVTAVVVNPSNAKPVPETGTVINASE